MSWRVGRKVPLNVYDGDDRPVCQCHTVEDARLIVEAVNELRASTSDWKSSARIAERESENARLWQSPDWKCTKCAYVNLAIRRACRYCGQARPADPVASTERSPPSPPPQPSEVAPGTGSEPK